VKLDKDKIKNNPGLRNVTKLLLNSFWGKFAQNDNKKQTVFITDVEKWIELFIDPKYVVSHVNLSIPETAIVQYTIKDELYESTNFNVNVVIAAFVTCYGRLRLYAEMKKLGERVLYHDTDSLMYTLKPGQYEPKLGEYLGELTNEISENDGGYIKELVCPGPKNYGYRTANGITKCVVKGISINYQSSFQLNFDIIKEKLLNDSEKEVFVTTNKFIRVDYENKTGIFNKKYDIKYNKAKVEDNFQTYPFGYIK